MKRLSQAVILSLAAVTLLTADRVVQAETAEEALARQSNLVLLNRLEDFTGRKHKIVGVYIVPASRKRLRGNAEINWHTNLINAPIEYGDYAVFDIDIAAGKWFDYRIDVEGTDGEGKPLQYFHPSSLLYERGRIVHHVINSVSDNTSPWKLDTKIDPEFGRK